MYYAHLDKKYLKKDPRSVYYIVDIIVRKLIYVYFFEEKTRLSETLHT